MEKMSIHNILFQNCFGEIFGIIGHINIKTKFSSHMDITIIPKQKNGKMIKKSYKNGKMGKQGCQ